MVPEQRRGDEETVALLRRLALDREIAGSLQSQIAGQLKRLIQTGELSAGVQLPSTRDLANSLQVSRNTVVAAYDMLVGQGYVEAQLRSGFKVCNAAQAFRSLPVVSRIKHERKQMPSQPGVPVPFRPTQPTYIFSPFKSGIGTGLES